MRHRLRAQHIVNIINVEEHAKARKILVRLTAHLIELSDFSVPRILSKSSA